MSISTQKFENKLPQTAAAEKGADVTNLKPGCQAVESVAEVCNGRFNFDGDDPDRALFCFDGPSVPVTDAIDDIELSYEILGLTDYAPTV